MIKAIELNLHRGIQLLNNISNNDYSDTSVAPYYSSIGGHMRHILDVFDCIFEGLDEKKINLINRKRNELVEVETQYGIQYFHDVLKKMELLQKENMSTIVKVTDDLGVGVEEVDYTLGAILVQAHSHAIHHFASVGYIIAQLGIELPDDNFGFNPTTPKKAEKH